MVAVATNMDLVWLQLILFNKYIINMKDQLQPVVTGFYTKIIFSIYMLTM